MPTTKEILTKARELIALPEHWTQGMSCRDKDGKYCELRSDNAHSFCLGGAVDRAMHLLGVNLDSEESYPIEQHVLNVVSRHAGERYVRFNDAEFRRHNQVLAVLDQAIAAE